MSSYRRKNPKKQVPSQLIIVVEGANRERDYYSWFAKDASSAVKVEVLAPKDEYDNAGRKIDDKGWVKPEHLLERLRRFCRKARNDVQPEDQIWIVLDADKFYKYHEVANFLNDLESDKELKTTTRMLVRSNPCLEIWLHLHLDDLPTGSKFGSCEPVKKIVGKLENGHGFDCTKHISIETIKAAIARAEKLNPGIEPNSIELPSPGTMLHLLAKQLLIVLEEKNSNAE
jgi:hypothetical protein